MSEHDELNDLLEKHAKSSGGGASPRRVGRKAQKGTSLAEMYGYDDDDDEVKVNVSHVQWTSNDGKIFVPAGKTKEALSPGIYEIDMSPHIGVFFRKIPAKTEGLLRFPDSNSNKVVSEIQKFWEREAVFDRYGLTYKRGIILYGPPGSGKSCTIQLVMADVIVRTGIVLKFTAPALFLEGMRVLREIQPETPIVTIMEDIDSILESYNESEVLNLLDGVEGINKVVFLATTNYPEVLGARIINRPSRFDKRFKIDYPSAEARRMYFEHLMGRDNMKKLKVDIKRWVEDTEKMSIAHLRELFIAVVVLDDDYEEAIKTLKTMKEPVDDKEYDQVGFHSSRS